MQQLFSTRPWFRTLLLLAFLSVLTGCVPDDDDVDDPQPTPSESTVTFWMRSDLGNGRVVVSVNNRPIGTLTQYHPSGVTCGQGEVTTQLAPGSYSYVATDEAGATWRGTFTLDTNTCLKYELTGQPSGGSQGVSNPIPTGYTSQGTITVDTPQLQICVRDHGQIDNDIIDLVIDGTTFLSNYTINGTNRCFTVTLPRGTHWIGVIARSEGTIPPCTPGITIKDATRSQVFELQSYVSGTRGAYTIRVQI
ncbi:hypothetical protein E5K00_00940 [Hymenobacter aquaticus]|uniref:DUF4397 domain-containing protein n=1 Tax=Hymenobacter aquaticus TaxID=1867101 RepID=A0A4Z0Q3X3_9BACT|nr:hypothetical protein [Hymenobacter aquaticus]TGE23813.1 hypothetical protein E5K00_00940 [Hymenobacter aquaticus]